MRDWLLHEGYKPQTVLNSLVGARTFFRWAIGSKLVVAAPATPKIAVPPRENVPVYVDDVDKIVQHAEGPTKTFLMLLWETGLRYAEAESMRGCDLDPVAKTVRVTDRGGFKPKRDASCRAVPVSDDLCDRLAALAPKPEDRMFPTTVKFPYQYWNHRFIAAQKAAGLPGTMSFHDFRRAVADRLRRGGVSVDAYCRYMGHAAITGLKHYATVDEADLRKAHAVALAGGRRRN